MCHVKACSVPCACDTCTHLKRRSKPGLHVSPFDGATQQISSQLKGIAHKGTVVAASEPHLDADTATIV